MRNKINQFIITLLMSLIFIGCSDFWGPEDPADETKTVPWDKLSGRIVFVNNFSEMGRSGSILYKMDVNKKSIEPLYTFNGSYPEWSFSGDFLLAVNGGKVDVSNLIDSSYNISFPQKSISFASWTTENKIAVVISDSTNDSTYSIWLADKPILQNLNGRKSRLSFSHDGKYLVVCISKPSNFFGNIVSGGIYKINLTSNTFISLKSLSSTNEYYEAPIFSFDDAKIAFIKVTQNTNENRELWIMNNDGANAYIMSTGTWDSNPAFSPQSNKIMFGRSGNLFLINVDGTGLTQLIKTGGGSPTWTK